ncbi:unnamed protein product [Trichobilharzia szidati]|nr:unnamed protein product [Trichobilharzia szidati]
MNRLDEFIEDCLREHNTKRTAHGVCTLRHSRALDKTAQDWAEELISEDGIKNSPLSSRGEVGESISVRTSTGTHVDIQGVEVVNQWYADVKNYSYESGKGPAGNFTQLVWSSTREVGFGKARGPGKCVVVAHYRPPGNVLGRYLENVFRPKELPKESVHQSKSDASVPNADVPKTVITETLKENDGKLYNVRREISESTDETGKTRRCINEVYTDARENQAIMASGDSQKNHFVDRSKHREESIHAVVELHNQYRSQHESSPLVLDPNLSDMAQQWADNLLQQTHLSNSGYIYQGLRVGENVGSRWSNGRIEDNCKELIEHWYQESEKFKYETEPDSIQGIGNFTQIVWSGSQSIGVGIASKSSYESEDSMNRDSKLIIVCLYYPPGNVIGQFKKNVKKGIQLNTGA